MMIYQKRNNRYIQGGATENGKLEPGVKYPKIIYASRTHSQLSQVVKELKMTQYK